MYGSDFAFMEIGRGYQFAQDGNRAQDAFFVLKHN
jgi:hypothetical protein